MRLRPLKRHGTREFARLSQSFLDMARRLNTRSSFISTFATHVSHELKSPLTSIQGAAELLRDDVEAPSMDDEDRRKFLDNIIADADRLTKISARLRDFARAENPVAVGAAKLSDTIAGLRSAFPSLELRAIGELDTPMRISEENASIIFSNLADNAMRHGSTALDLIRDAAGQSAADQHGRQWRRRFAQQPRADLRQFFHHAARQRRHRHGAGHRARHAGRPWRRDPPARFRTREPRSKLTIPVADAPSA